MDLRKVITRTKRTLSNPGNAASYCNACKILAPIKCVDAYACDAVRNGDACKIEATLERQICKRLSSTLAVICARKGITRLNQMIADIEDAIFPICFIIVIYGIIECRISDAGDAVRDRNACKVSATIECITSNAGDAVRDRNACKVFATGERGRCDRLCSAFDGVRARESIACLNQMIAQIEDIVFPVVRIVVISRILYGTAADNSNAVGNRDICKIDAAVKCGTADVVDMIPKGNACKIAASLKRLISNVCHVARNCDACKGAASLKRLFSNVFHGQAVIFVGND